MGYNEKCMELLRRMIEKEPDQAKAKMYVEELDKISSVVQKKPQPDIVTQGRVRPHRR